MSYSNNNNSPSYNEIASHHQTFQQQLSQGMEGLTSGGGGGAAATPMAHLTFPAAPSTPRYSSSTTSSLPSLTTTTTTSVGYHHNQNNNNNQHKRRRSSPSNYHVGDRVDAMDLEGVWHEGEVKEVCLIQGYRVHFLGWSSRWDEWVNMSSKRIQPAYTKIRNWRPALSVGDPVEVRSAVYQDRWLSGVVVAVCPEEGTVKCEYSHDSRWIYVKSEELCLPNTHFSRALDSMAPQKVEQIYRESPIHAHCREGEIERVKVIIEQDPQVVHLKGPLERTPLLIASDKCRLEIIRLLIKAGASLTDIDRSNANCLHLAVRGEKERCPEVVKALVELGADVTGRDSRLSTPLHLVAMRGYYDVGLTLIEYGAEVNARDMSLVTPLRHAAYRGEEAMVRLLLHFGADPSICDAAGERPMDVVCCLRNEARCMTVEHLLMDGHIGYLLKKMRNLLVGEHQQNLMMVVHEDEEEEAAGSSHNVATSLSSSSFQEGLEKIYRERRQVGLEIPLLEFHPPQDIFMEEVKGEDTVTTTPLVAVAAAANKCKMNNGMVYPTRSSSRRGGGGLEFYQQQQQLMHGALALRHSYLYLREVMELNHDMFEEFMEYFV